MYKSCSEIHMKNTLKMYIVHECTINMMSTLCSTIHLLEIQILHIL